MMTSPSTSSQSALTAGPEQRHHHYGWLKCGSTLGVLLISAMAAAFWTSNPHSAMRVLWYRAVGCPSWSASDGEAIAASAKYGVMKRVHASNISRGQFVDLVSRGEPFVIRAAFADWPVMQEITNCSVLQQHYPNMYYYDWQADTKESLGSIGDWTCRSGYLERAGGTTDLHDHDRLHSDAERQEWREWGDNGDVFHQWLSTLPIPEFMPSDVWQHPADPESEHVPQQPSMSAFIGSSGTGVTPHLDENCESFVSVQFSGRKLWTVAWPEVNESSGALQWSTPLAVVLERGDAIIWYMSQMHHTEVLDGCSFSMSIQFTRPAPHLYHAKLRTLYRDTPGWQELYRQLETSNDEYFSKCSVRKDTHSDQWVVSSDYTDSQQLKVS
ncbi:uncharacterized protein LOC135816179 [Sycon ciliatum]|uniref:uncharacterized protein LOC135816179 n=1 Tax=Sycon ciliatum TaxID=27933 RepID=UPI0031F6A4D6